MYKSATKSKTATSLDAYTHVGDYLQRLHPQDLPAQLAGGFMGESLLPLPIVYCLCNLEMGLYESAELCVLPEPCTFP